VDVKWGIYTLEQELGRGGMAVVYCASKVRDGDFKRIVCLKRILPELSNNPEFVKMFRQEARIAASLNHPNIVAVNDFNRIEGQLFLEMELIDGIDLGRLLWIAVELGMTVPLGFARYVTACLLAALAHAHGQVVGGVPAPVIHRDVSPSNILLSTEGEVKLTDYGIAKVRGSAVVTEVGDVKGKFSYLSPEQARGHAIDTRSDLYGAGLVLYELLTGERFNRGEDRGGEMGQAKDPGNPALPWLSAEWNSLLAGLLARSPDDRFSSAEEALAELGRIKGLAPYGHSDVGHLVRRVRELLVAFASGEPTEAGGPAEQRSADDLDALAEEVTTSSSQDVPRPDVVSAAEMRPGSAGPVAQPRRQGRRNWIKAALLFAAALGLSLLAIELIRGAAGGAGVEGSPPRELVEADRGALAMSRPPDQAVQPDAEVAPVPEFTEGEVASEAAREAAPARGPGFGHLEVNCRPWARVVIDGRDVGTTPIKDLKVRAGQRHVTLVNEELGFRRSFPVDVPRGGAASLSRDITAGARPVEDEHAGN